MRLPEWIELQPPTKGHLSNDGRSVEFAVRVSDVFRSSVADRTPGRWDGSGTIDSPCDEPTCQFFGEYHRFSGHTTRPCSTCGATETVEISDERQSLRICAECGSDEP